MGRGNRKHHIIESIEWGSQKQPFYRPGKNPTVDVVFVREKTKELEVLLIKRSNKPEVAEAGKYALPGGFHDTDAPKGKPWQEGLETARQAAIREVIEETGLDATTVQEQMQEIGVYDQYGRDPRDNNVAWAVSTAFVLKLGNEINTDEIAGADDADEAKWVPLSEIKDLAFDHNDILADGINLLK